MLNAFGNPHRNYKLKKNLCEEIIQQMNAGNLYNCHLIAELSRKHNIPIRTLYNWQHKIEGNDEWRPYKKRRRSDRKLTDDQENNIADFIEKNYVDQHKHFNDSSFAKLAYSLDYSIRDFKCSHNFISDFKKRNRFSSRKAHFKKRPNNFSNDDIEKFIQKIKEEKEKSNYTEIWVNCDETQLTILPKRASTWAKTNTDNIYISCSDNDKEAITALCTIQGVPEFKKLPLFLIGKDQTENQKKTPFPKNIQPHKTTFSNSGWNNEILFRKYLRFLRKQFPQNSKINLILDQSSTHKGNETESLANKLNIKFYFIPAGCTDNLQPLDIRVNGVIKAIGDKKKADLMDILEEEQVGISNSISVLIDIWDNIISIDTIQDSWSLYTQ